MEMDRWWTPRSFSPRGWKKKVTPLTFSLPKRPFAEQPLIDNRAESIKMSGWCNVKNLSHLKNQSNVYIRTINIRTSEKKCRDWTSLSKFERVWASLSEFEQVWTSLNEFEHDWTSSNSLPKRPFAEHWTTTYW